MMHDYWYYTGGSSVWGYVFMSLMMILLVIGVVLAVRYLVQSDGGSQASKEEDALVLLKKRYANGEIDKREYDQKRKDLSK